MKYGTLSIYSSDEKKKEYYSKIRRLIGQCETKEYKEFSHAVTVNAYRNVINYISNMEDCEEKENLTQAMYLSMLDTGFHNDEYWDGWCNTTPPCCCWDSLKSFMEEEHPSLPNIIFLGNNPMDLLNTPVRFTNRKLGLTEYNNWSTPFIDVWKYYNK